MTRAAEEPPAESWLTTETQTTVMREVPMMGGRHRREAPFRAASLSGLTLSLPARTFLEEGTGVQQRVRTRAGFKSQTWSKFMYDFNPWLPPASGISLYNRSQELS